MPTPTHLLPTYHPLLIAHREAAVLAVFPDGKLAITYTPGFATSWHPVASPDYEALFGATVPRTTWLDARTWACACEPPRCMQREWVTCTRCDADRPSVGPSAEEAEGATRDR